MHKIQIITQQPKGGQLPECYNETAFSQVRTFHHSLEGYAPTPLISLSCLAKQLGVHAIYIKDESKRFGLNAFKALGASYAVSNVLENNPNITEIVTATDGNHGRAVAWSAGKRGKKATIFMPVGSADERVQAIRNFANAAVFVTDVNYNDTVRMAYDYAKDNNACLVQDTGFDGYQEIPENITLGYSTMAAEALEQLAEISDRTPSHVFLQAGVGSFAGGMMAYLVNKLKAAVPKFTVVEAEEVACIYESIRQQKNIAIGGNPQTTMAGLNCGEANIFTMPVLQSFADCFIKCPDEISFRGMRQLAYPLGNDLPVVSGESGAVCLGVVIELLENAALAEYKHKLRLNEQSDILLFSTEGNTDARHYFEVVGAK